MRQCDSSRMNPRTKERETWQELTVTRRTCKSLERRFYHGTCFRLTSTPTIRVIARVYPRVNFIRLSRSERERWRKRSEIAGESIARPRYRYRLLWGRFRESYRDLVSASNNAVPILSRRGLHNGSSDREGRQPLRNSTDSCFLAVFLCLFFIFLSRSSPRANPSATRCARHVTCLSLSYIKLQTEKESYGRPYVLCILRARRIYLPGRSTSRLRAVAMGGPSLT